MKKVFKTSLILISIVIIISGSCVAVFAHPGKTDSDGGHFDRSTGEYHYHHGYPAHQHENGTCPYDFDNNEKSTESHNYGYDYESIRDKYATATSKEPITKKSQLDFISDYEKLEEYYKDARQQISETNTYDTQLYSDFLVLNTQIIHDLPSYKGYMNDNKYNEIQKQTKLYRNFLDNNNPNNLEYIETTTETSTSVFNNMSTVEKVFTIMCYCFFAVYIIEVIILTIMLLVRDIKDYDFASAFFNTIVFLIYAFITFGYFSFLFNDDKNIYVLFFVYLPAPIISTYMLYVFIDDIVTEKNQKKVIK
ncbi:ig-like domain-containing surface protein [Eubacterium sp. CAG:251]|nr:ig-like domain-containing surface protein [Eubacterium sp. CAG:251]